MVKPGGILPFKGPCTAACCIVDVCRHALFYETRFVLVLPDGSCGEQEAQEEEMDRAPGTIQAKVGLLGEEGGRVFPEGVPRRASG